MDDIEGDAATTTAPREEITLKEVVPESTQGKLENAHVHIMCNHTQIMMCEKFYGLVFT